MTRTGGCVRSGVGDYDRAGGSCNGPNYVRGPVYVVGPDVFGVDGDGDEVRLRALSLSQHYPPIVLAAPDATSAGQRP